MQTHQGGGRMGNRVWERDKLPAYQPSSPLLGTEYTHGALTAGSAGVVAHRFTDLRQPVGGRALTGLELLVDVAALGRLGIQLGCADGCFVTRLDFLAD